MMQLRGFWAWAVLIVLFLSLGANFFLAGFLFERARGGFGGGPPGIVSVLADFPPDVRRAIRQRLWGERQQFRETIRQVREKRREVVEALRAPVIDRARVTALLGEVRTLTGTMQERAQAAILDTLEAMPAEQRAQIGEPRRWRERRWQAPWRNDEREEAPPPAPAR